MPGCSDRFEPSLATLTKRARDSRFSVRFWSCLNDRSSRRRCWPGCDRRSTPMGTAVVADRNRLRNLIQSLNNCLQNQFFGPVAFVLGIPVHVVHRVEQWREHVGPHILTGSTPSGRLKHSVRWRALRSNIPPIRSRRSLTLHRTATPSFRRSTVKRSAIRCSPPTAVFATA